MIAISVNGLSLDFGDVPILEKVSFSLEENDKLGVIGVNGCGKSTLFKLILGELEPREGEIYFSKGKTVGILTQDGAFDCENENMTVLERMYSAFPTLLSMEKRLSELEATLEGAQDHVIREYSELHEKFVGNGGLEFRGRCAAILSRLGFDKIAQSLPVSVLSGGQRTRLALATELLREPDILMLDEPTNHLDIETLAWLESFLVSYPKCVMIISHDRYFLDKVTNKTLSIEHRRAKLYNGGYTKSMEQRRIDREIAERHWKNQQKEIARQEAYIAQQRAWNRERNIIAAESRLKLLEKMERVERPENDPRSIRMRFGEAIASGNDVLNVRSLSMSFSERVLFRDISFLVRRGERVMIIGPNGCGKSTLIKLILSRLTPTAGVIEEGYNVQIGYYDQENQNLTPENTVLDELWNAYPQKTETEIRNTLALFRFTGEDVFKTVSVLSGGERARLTFAKLMLSRMNLLVLDEPTNHLDIDSREALESALEQFDGTIVTVSHDRYLIEKLATRILEIHPGACFEGDLLDYEVTHPGTSYTEFRAYKTLREERAAEEGCAPPRTVSAGKEQYLKAKQANAEARRKRAQLDRLKKECEELESELSRIEEELFGSAASDYLRAAELDTRKNEIEERLMEIYEALENEDKE
ncbi:MAG: ABC-F family ATP-binding cassette domain-containing protein [Ruminococcaceae bacterium]|nr:ABC-F family ATP-binding cassette domain-containing protein [Oscillospiraceae bacterium]